MTYFKFTDSEDNEMYGSINADNVKIDFTKLKAVLHAKTLVKVSKEEYDAQDEGGEND